MLKKTYFLSILFLSFISFLAQKSIAQSKTLKKGNQAYIFSADASLAGNEFNFSLKEKLTKGPVVVYFFPSAYTSGCDLEAHTFAEYKEQFTAAGASIIGVSADNIKRLNAFSSDPDYCSGKFPVASDPDGKIAIKYGLDISPLLSGAKDSKGNEINHGFIPRTTFVINKKGKIIAVFSTKKDKLSPVDHVKKSLAIVKKL